MARKSAKPFEWEPFDEMKKRVERETKAKKTTKKSKTSTTKKK